MANKWWEKYKGNHKVLETAAKEYWSIYSNIITKADQKLTRAWVENPTKTHKEILNNWDLANQAAQPLLEDWIEICQELGQVIR